MDLLDLLAEAGYNPRRLWKAIPATPSISAVWSRRNAGALLDLVGFSR